MAGSPSPHLGWSELAESAARNGSPLAAEVDFVPSGPTFPFGAHLAVVEVDTDTGKVVLRRLVAVDDAGRIVNPLLAEGQVHGGLAQGVAQALLEEFSYDANGNPLTSTLADYTFISAAELPSFETFSMETPTPVNQLGAKGIGESGTIGSTPAVTESPWSTCSQLGVRHVDMPTTPERVCGERSPRRKAAIQRSRHRNPEAQGRSAADHRVPLAVGRPRFLGQPGTRTAAGPRPRRRATVRGPR